MFSNIRIDSDLLLSRFLSAVPDSRKELWIANGDLKTYKFLPAQSGEQEFIVLLIFHGEKLNRVSISVNHPGATWEDETPEQIEQDGELLRQVMYTNFNGQHRNQQFDWGKVELWQDVKNALDYSIVVTYSKQA
ncbi:MAG: hypothetical protein EOO39_13980 [Cytophagaceae bacterium]|nr:MAG: hypothetical protein EOO39_13980 [Cytophagaceae bacterium]